MHHRSNIL